MSVSLVLGRVLPCAQPHPDPKTGDVASEPEQPAVVTKASEAWRREPSPAEAAADKPVKSPTDLRS